MAVTEPNLDFRDAPDGSLVWTIVDEPGLHAAKITPNITAPQMRYVQLSQNPSFYPGGWPSGAQLPIDFGGHPAAPNSLLRTNDISGAHQAFNPAVSFVGAHYSLDITQPAGTQLAITAAGLYVVQYSIGDPGAGTPGPFLVSVKSVQSGRLGHTLTIDPNTVGNPDPVSAEDTLPVFAAAVAGFLHVPAPVGPIISQNSGGPIGTSYFDVTVYRVTGLG